jgi:predicted nicotinamide N-methyase
MDSDQTDRHEFVTLSPGRLTLRLAKPRQAIESGDRISFWWSITASALALARHLETIDLRTRRVIELGCGLGLAGVTAGVMGAEITFSDSVSEAVEFASRNALLNSVPARRVSCRLLDWEAPGELSTFSLVLGSEILYDYYFHGPLLRLLPQLMEPDGVLLLADRKRLVASRFLGRLISAGFICSETVHDMDVEGFPALPVSVFELRRGEA